MRFMTFTTALLLGTTLAAGGYAKPVSKDPGKPYVTNITTDPTAKADPDMKKVLAALADLKGKPIEKLSAAEARKQPTPTDAVKVVARKEGIAIDTSGVTTKELSYGDDKEQKARVYIPDGAEGRKLPIVVYYHGGGWVIADLDVYDASPRAMAKSVDAIVVSVEYRHAPEHKFPAAHEDAFDAYRWVLKNGASWGGDTTRVAVMGESAGGNLAINTAIAARDGGIQLPTYQVLVYPVAGVNMQTPSYQENEYAKPLNKAMMKWFVKHALRSDADKKDPRIDLVGKAELKGLPAATIITAEIDPLRSEGRELADKLRQAGVPVDAMTYEGVTHEFFGMGAVVEDAKKAEDLAAGDLKAAFGGSIPAAK